MFWKLPCCQAGQRLTLPIVDAPHKRDQTSESPQFPLRHVRVSGSKNRVPDRPDALLPDGGTPVQNELREPERLVPIRSQHVDLVARNPQSQLPDNSADLPR